MTTHTRFIIITTDTNEKIVFGYEGLYDSGALHRALCSIDPGDNYTVKFTNQRPRRGKNVSFVQLPR